MLPATAADPERAGGPPTPPQRRRVKVCINQRPVTISSRAAAAAAAAFGHLTRSASLAARIIADLHVALRMPRPRQIRWQGRSITALEQQPRNQLSATSCQQLLDLLQGTQQPTTSSGSQWCSTIHAVASVPTAPHPLRAARSVTNAAAHDVTPVQKSTMISQTTPANDATELTWVLHVTTLAAAAAVKSTSPAPACPPKSGTTISWVLHRLGDTRG